MERARNIGRNLLSMARGGGSSEEDRAEGAHHMKRRSWSDVVSNSPQISVSSQLKTNKEPREGAGKANPTVVTEKCQGPSPGRDGSSQKLFSVEDVAKLVEIARNQLRKEKEVTSGWKEMEARDARSREKAYARELVEGFRGSPDTQFKRWQCDKPGHKSSDCPKGERCFTCNSEGHKRAHCPMKRKITRQEKGKGLDLGGDAPRMRNAGGIHIGDSWPPVGKGVAKPTKDDVTEKKEWRRGKGYREEGGGRRGRGG